MTSDTSAARAVLLLAKASLAEAPRVTSVRLMPQNEQLSLEAAEDALAAMGKPLQCVAHLQGETIVLQVTAELDGHAAQLYQAQQLFLRDKRGVVGSLLDETKSTDLIGLEGRGELLALTFGTLQTVQRDYVMMTPLSWGKRRATAAESAQGLSWVISVGRVERLGSKEVDDLLHTLPRVDTGE
jgi:hypothetical protein